MRRFLFLWGVVLSAFLFSCSKETSLQPNEVEETVYQKVGRMHNEGLDYVLDYIKQNKGTIMTRSVQPLSKDEILSLVEPAVKEFIKVSSESGRFGPFTRSSDNGFGFDLSSVDISAFRNTLSDAGIGYLDRVVSVFDSEEDHDRKITSLSELVLEIGADKSIDQQSKESLLYAIEVGISSFKYWTERVHEWYLTFNGYDTPSTRSASVFYAQGWVRDNFWVPKENVTIQVQGRNMFTWTDSNGYYGITMSLADMIVVTMDGYVTQYVPAEEYHRGETEPIVFLQPVDGSSPGSIRDVILADLIAAGLAAFETLNPYSTGIAACSGSIGAAAGFLVEGAVSTE